MPIRPENKARYPKDWPEISRRIREERADNKCEWCQAPNRTVIYRFNTGEWMETDGTVHDANTGEYLGMCRGSEAPAGRFVEIVLTVAHLDHTPEHNEESNLAALCQRCHNRYDGPERRKGIRERARAQLACGDLFELDAPREGG